MARTPDDICFLCLKEKATKTNSHIIPAGILKEGMGKRDKELIYTINSLTKSIKSYFGRERLDNPSEEIKSNPAAVDYYFCPNCEALLGSKLESLVIPELQNFKINANVNFSDSVSKGGLKLRTFNKLDSATFNVFFLSVVWRMALLYSERSKIEVLGAIDGPEMNLWRLIIHSFLYQQPNYEQIQDQYCFECITSDNFKDPSTCFSLTIDFVDSPNLFIVQEFLIRFYSASDGEVRSDGHKNMLWDNEVINYSPHPPRIIVLPENDWEDLRNKMIKGAARIYINGN
jgi:hypothetical protein